MSAHLEVIEAEIQAMLDQLSFPLHSGQEKQTAAAVQDERGRFYTDYITILIDEEDEVPTDIRSGLTKVN